jgi:membrane-bound metal-dependent hydrolase YbcI (DUF457 family)
MALPIAHATAGYLVHRLDRRGAAWAGSGRALAFMAIGNLPDVDFVVGFALGTPGAFHRGISHTVLAAVVFGVVAGTLVWWRRKDGWWPATLLCAAAYASHLLVDALTVDARGPAGAQFFWPLSDAYYIFPVTVFGEILIDGTSRGGFVQSIVAWPTVGVLVREALFATAGVAAMALLDGVRGAGETAASPAAEGGEVDDAVEEDLA